MITPASHIRACVVGANEKGRHHVQGWKAVAGAQVLAVVDTDERRAQELAAEFGVRRTYTDYRAVMQRGDINAISICTPGATHPSIAIHAANHNKHVLCEPSLALTLRDCDTIINTARGKRVAIGVGFSRRFLQSSNALREIIDDKGIGRPVMYRVHSLVPVQENVAVYDKEEDGGVFCAHFTHYFDFWCWLFRSEPVRVMARGFTWATYRPRLEAKRALGVDTGIVMVEFSSGDIGVITTSWALPEALEKYRTHQEEVCGPWGLIVECTQEGFTLVNRDGKGETISFPGQDPYGEEIKDFAMRLRMGEPPRATGEDGKRALRVALAVLEAIETSKAVEL